MPGKKTTSPSLRAEEETPAPYGSGHGRERSLTAAQQAMIKNWMQLADVLGIPRSLAQIYGLLYFSEEPLSAQDCVDSLKISRSSAGQGLKTLKDVGAIRPAYEPGARRETFTIEPDLGVLVRNILEGRIVPAFHDFFARVEDLAEREPDLPAFTRERLAKLQRWQAKLSAVAAWTKL